MPKVPSAILLALALAGCAAPEPKAIADPTLELPDMQCMGPCSRSVTQDPWWGWEPSIGVDPTDVTHLVVGIHDDPWAASPHWPGAGIESEILPPGVIRISSAVSFDGGGTWERRFLPIFPEAPMGSLWSVICNQGDPIVQFAPDGRLFLFGLGIGCSDGGLLLATSYVFVTESQDGGLTWREPTFIWQGTGAAVQFNDKPGATVDQSGNLVIAWTTFSAAISAATLMVSTSTDGVQWTTPDAIVTDANVGNQGVENGVIGDDFQNHYAMPIHDLEGTIHVAFRACHRACIKVASGGPGDWAIQEVARLSGGSRETAQYSLGEPLMTLDVDYGGPRPGRIYLAYADALDGWRVASYGAGGADWDVDIVAKWSDDGGVTWSDAVAVSPQDGDDQFHPWMQAEDGILHLFYLDRVPGGPEVQATYGRYDVATNTSLEVHLDDPWEPNPQDQYIPAFGHYESLEVEAGRVAIAWTRVLPPKPDQEAYSGSVGYDRDVYVAYWDGARWR